MPLVPGARPTLSVVCVTNDRGPRLAAALTPLRAVADEVVVCADDRVDAADLGWYRAVADRLVRYPFELPVERPFAWAHAQCRGDWILRVDGDEVVSPALVARLPELVARTDVLQCWTPRRWLFPDGAHWLAERPWSPDLQLRLVRNDPALLSFAGTMHTTARRVEPYAVLDEPIYHLDLLVNPEERRRRKAVRYEELHPGMRVSGGGPQEVYYLPEDWAGAAALACPPADAERIAAVLGAPAAPAPPPVDPATVPVATRAEVDAHWDALPLADADYAARVELVDTDPRLEPGADDEVTVRVTNLGGRTWPGGLERLPRVRIAHRWLEPGGAPLHEAGARAAFPGPVAPGASVLVRVPVRAPEVAGDATLELELVDELVRWFGDPCRAVLRISPRAASGALRARP